MDYQSNSRKSKEPEAKKQEAPKKEIQPITTAQEKKKPLHRRMKGLLFGGEFQTATQYIFAEVLLPAARNLIVDATTKGIERMVYGEARPRPTTSRYDGRARVSYHSPLRVREDPRREFRPPDQPPRPIQSQRQTNEIVFETREDAEKVLEALLDIVDQYDIVAVADLNALCNLPSANVDNKWGWGYLAGTTEIRQIRDGWVLDLPPVEPIQ